MEMRGRAPAYRDPVLHFNALRLVALREGDRTEETLATENEREILIRAPAHVHSARAALFLLLEHRLQPTPSPLCGLASWPLLGACSMYRGEKFVT